MYRLIVCPELDEFGFAVKVNAQEGDSHELRSLEVVDSATPLPKYDATIDWNVEALEELERGIRRAVASNFKNSLVPKDLRLEDTMDKIVEIWREARAGSSLW